jgi:hypothetical protein
MNPGRCLLLIIYRFLLYLYPSAFRHRFAAEMMQLASEAEPAEWPLIFGDTSAAIVRRWFEPSSASASAASAAPDAYLPIGGSALTALRLFQGLALALVILLGLSYIGSLGYVGLSKCHSAAVETMSQ